MDEDSNSLGFWLPVRCGGQPTFYGLITDGTEVRFVCISCGAVRTREDILKGQVRQDGDGPSIN